jgi:tetratricopeptide (TPR) repeat protein
LAGAEGQRHLAPHEAGLNSRDLLAVAPEARHEAIASQARFRDLTLAESLLALARESAADDPLGSRHLAGLAMAILESLAASARASRLQAEASGLLGEAERRSGRLDLAEDFFKDAAHSLRDQPLILESRVRLCRWWAALRQEQGRVDEALGLLERASTLAEELGEFRELALSRLAYGWLLLEELDSEGAILPLRDRSPSWTRTSTRMPSFRHFMRSHSSTRRWGTTAISRRSSRCSTSLARGLPTRSIR